MAKDQAAVAVRPDVDVLGRGVLHARAVAVRTCGAVMLRVVMAERRLGALL